jgi:CRISPR type I-F-associated protein Csy2
MSTFFYISLEISKANMLQNPSFITPAPVFATLMAMHALDMRLGGQLGVNGVGIIHHDHRPWIDYPTTNEGYIAPALVQRRGAYLLDGVPKPQATPMQPMALTDLKWSLLLSCDNDIETAQIKHVLMNMRLAGGQINEERLRVRSFEKLDDAVGHIRNGYWLEDVTSILALDSVSCEMQQKKVEQDQTEKQLSNVSTIKVDLSKNPAERLLQLTSPQVYGFSGPVNLGYSLLSAPTKRRGSRDIRGEACDHAYAEHLIGLVQFIPVRKAKERGIINASKFWRSGWVGDEFLVTNNADIALSKEKGEGTSLN